MAKGVSFGIELSQFWNPAFPVLESSFPVSESARSSFGQESSFGIQFWNPLVLESWLSFGIQLISGGGAPGIPGDPVVGEGVY